MKMFSAVVNFWPRGQINHVKFTEEFHFASADERTQFVKALALMEGPICSEVWSFREKDFGGMDYTLNRVLHIVKALKEGQTPPTG